MGGCHGFSRVLAHTMLWLPRSFEHEDTNVDGEFHEFPDEPHLRDDSDGFSGLLQLSRSGGGLFILGEHNTRCHFNDSAGVERATSLPPKYQHAAVFLCFMPCECGSHRNRARYAGRIHSRFKIRNGMRELPSQRCGKYGADLEGSLFQSLEQQPCSTRNMLPLSRLAQTSLRAVLHELPR
jgi:hypothetical protein